MKRPLRACLSLALAAALFLGCGAPRPAQAPRFSPRGQQPLPPSGDQSFEDKLKQFLSSSEGKMADLNRSIDGKRGGGRRRK